jgi:hypothetical protein
LAPKYVITHDAPATNRHPNRRSFFPRHAMSPRRQARELYTRKQAATCKPRRSRPPPSRDRIQTRNKGNLPTRKAVPWNRCSKFRNTPTNLR